VLGREVVYAPLASLVPTTMAPVWLLVRVYLGFLWFMAGFGKLYEPGWITGEPGAAVAGFAQGAMQQTTGEHPQVTGWYAGFLENFVVPNAALFAYLVTFGEILVGLALITGLATGIAAFFGGLMNASFIFAGTAGANPLMFILAILLMLSWRVAGYWAWTAGCCRPSGSRATPEPCSAAAQRVNAPG
jgi:thiosulfate dehydrogenase (quinone) large subunit